MTLLSKCKDVLEKNWRGTFTIPSARLYPFQWNWDSGFISIGLRHINPQRAIQEMETLFSGQWSNGFLPHIIFHDSHKYTSYFPSADYWNSNISPFAPASVKTSGITQPPVHGFVLEYLFNHGIDQERVLTLFDKVMAYHTFLYEYREHKSSGLVAIWHNWESGMDNSVWWDDILERIDDRVVNDITLKRKDVYEVAESENTRPKDRDYKRYIYLVNKLRDSKYENVSEDYPFQILDPVFNSMLMEANASLIRLGNKIGRDTTFLKNKTEIGRKHFSTMLWNEQDSLYYPLDLITGTQVRKNCSGCYIPLFAHIPSEEQAEKLLGGLIKLKHLFLIPSTIPDQTGFEQKNYWRGPVWVNMNWLLWKGLIIYNKDEMAEYLRENTLKMVEKFGVYEYFDPFENTTSKTGYGGVDFSWSAALSIDMLRG